MKVPTWQNLKTNYPALDADKVFKKIGGKVELNYDIGVFSNACAIRVSRSLNEISGAHSIPYIESTGPSGKIESQVSSGKNKEWNIFRVRILTQYLTKKYGKPEKYKRSNYKKELNNRKGIIIFDVPGWGDATGHADLWNGKKCLWKGYGGQATSIFFWEAS